ncbi:sugar ABC transporter permease, partial [Microvirga sp. 3-52]|nr:sugar ABC transporter permease [Microvirga sp. 3-52]
MNKPAYRSLEAKCIFNFMKGRLKMKNRLFKYSLLAPALILIAATTFYPLMRSFWISLHEWDLKESTEIGSFVGVNNYLRAFSDIQFWHSVGVTFIFATSTV